MKQHKDFFLAACKCLGVYPEVISGSGRCQSTVTARRIIAYVLRERLQLSYPDIAAVISPGRSHSSVITSVKAYKTTMENDPTYIDLSHRVHAAICKNVKTAGRLKPKAPVVVFPDFWMEFAKEYHRELDGEGTIYGEDALRDFGNTLEAACKEAVKRCKGTQWLLATGDCQTQGTQKIREAAIEAAERVAASMNTSLEELREHTRTHQRSRARHILYFTMRFHFVDSGFRPSFDFIAQVIAKCDHTSVIYGVYKAKRLIERGDKAWREMAETAKRALLGEAEVEAHEEAQVELQEVAA